MEYAVIETGGKQYKVSPGMTIKVEKLAGDAKNISFDKVLLHVSGDDVSIGKPYLNGVAVTAKLKQDLKGDKIRVARFKAKANYRRTTGHRQSLSEVEIEKIVKNTSKSVKTTQEKTNKTK